MPKNHTVVQGECLSSIAAAEGFRDWRTIYDDPANADFRTLRPNPNLVYPGDVIVIPDRTPPTFQAATGQAFTYTLSAQQTVLRLRFDDAGDLGYSLQAGSVSVEGGTVLAGSILEVAIPPDIVTAQLVTWPTTFASADDAGDAAIRWNLLVGHLDPADTVSGVQARLKNLGYGPLAVDGVSGPDTEAAIREFQADNPPLEVDGVCGPKTTDALVSAYGL